MLSILQSLLVACCLFIGSFATSNATLTNSTNSIHLTLNTTFSNIGQADLEVISARLSSIRAQATVAPPLKVLPAATAAGTFNATEEEVTSARSIVSAAHASQSAYNEYQLANPRFNTHESRFSSDNSKKNKKRQQGAVEQPVLSDDQVAAIRLVAHTDAKAKAANGTLLTPFNRNSSSTRGANIGNTGGYTTFRPNAANTKRQTSGDCWMGDMDHLGTQPFGGDADYVVWRNVKDYGAVGDGVTDDTAAIQLAISDGGRCGVGCLSSSVKGALVYFPYPGIYLVSTSIAMYYNTQIVGCMDPLTGTTPTILAASSFTGFGVLSSDVYLPGGQSEWYIEQSNFYRQIRQIQFDLGQAELYNIAAIHWQVAQATSISLVTIVMTAASTSSQVGIWAENGSGGFLSDITFYGGLYGFLGGNQQYTATNLYFYQCNNGIGLIWDWGWVWADLFFDSCTTAINLDPPGASVGDPVGSMYLMDTAFENCEVCIYTFPFASGEAGTTVFTFDNIYFSGNTYFIVLTNGEYLEYDVTSVANLDFETIGDIVSGGASDGFYTVNVPTRQAILVEGSGTDASNTDAQIPYFTRFKPTYYNYGSSSFINAKHYAYGDGVHDDTTVIQDLFLFCAYYNYILFFPAGSYMISSTIIIPVNSYVVGEVWSQFVAYGATFEDETNPVALIQVGQGDSGLVEMQDLLFTSVGNLPGLVLVSWAVSASEQGGAAMWDCHFRIGGAIGTDLQVAQCPIKSGGIIDTCIAASIMLLVNSGCDGYFENVWAWNADHDIDDPQNTQVDIYVGRGMLIETDGPSWFWASASEHSVLYQYNLVNANNVFMSMIQTESPYFQGYGATQAPAPFETDVVWIGDPVFDMCGSGTLFCNMAWAIIIQTSTNIFINGAGLYSWFQNYDETCVNTANCQQRLINIYEVANLWFNHIVTIGSVEVVTPAISNSENEIIYATAVTQALVYPWWTAIAVYLDSIATPANNMPLKTGFVSFGESYASGIGTGTPYDNNGPCYRGTGSYSTLFKQLYDNYWDSSLDLQFLACSGSQSPDLTNGQIPQWVAANSDMALVSDLGNDAGFGGILRSCMVGSDKETPCATALTNADNFVASTNNYIDEWFENIVRDIINGATGAGKERFVVYWIGYPEFFEVLDSTCDTDYFWIWPANQWWRSAGEYLTLELRGQMNDISVALNQRIQDATNNWNSELNYPQVVFLSPDATIYPNHRFCEPGITEPQSNSKQASVAFFYPSGPDVLPTAIGIPPGMPGAPGSWGAEVGSINSADCVLGTDAAGNSFYPYFFCDQAVALAADPSGIATWEEAVEEDWGDYNATATLESDGSVTISGFSEVGYFKMFHPKSAYQYQIAQLINAKVRVN